MTATAITDEIKASFDALGLILVFITVLFGIKYSTIWEDLKSTIPDPARRIDRRQHRQRLWKSIMSGCAPLFVVTGAAWTLFLPLFVHVAGDEPFHPWNRDVTQNAFLFVAGMTGIFFVWSAGFLVAMFWKITRSWWGGRLQ